MHRAEDDHLAYLGWEVAGRYDLQVLVDAVEATGVTVEHVDASEARSRGVLELVRFQDPAGTPVEVFYGQHSDFRFASPLGIEFVTDPCGLGHVMLSVNAFDECVDFYCNVLGFRVTTSPIWMAFMRPFYGAMIVITAWRFATLGQPTRLSLSSRLAFVT